MALKKRRSSRHLLAMGLNITSLIDVLTVLIFFLVKSITVNSVVLSPPADLNIPKTVSDTALEDSISVSISNSEIRLNNEVVLKLENGLANKEFFEADNRTIKPLKALLEKEYKKKSEQLAESSKNKKLDLMEPVVKDDKVERLPTSASELAELMPAKIIIQADKDLPFHTIQYLLHTAAVSGYTDYQFVVAPK